MTGIDISYAQETIPPGAWDFVFCRATHSDTGAVGATHVDSKFVEHFAAARKYPHRGAYHFADPRSDGASQARVFVATCLANGFRPNVDSWTYDAERPGLTRAHWLAFRTVALAALGHVRFLYVGFPFYEANFGPNLDLLHQDPWWLPAYGPNDGTPHAPNGIPFLPVIHQYSSRGGPNRSGLDVNRVLDTAAWSRLYAPEVLLHAQFPHALGIVSWCQFTHPTLGPKCVAAVDATGAVFCLPGNAYLGGMNGSKAFAGRTAATITAESPTGYTITDTAKETYHFLKA